MEVKIILINYIENLKIKYLKSIIINRNYNHNEYY